MKKETVRHYLKEYKYALDWIEIYDSKFEANMGMSYSHAPGGSNQFNSDVENKVIDRDERYAEYQEKKEYVASIERVLDKLPADELIIIRHEFNLVGDEYYSKFPVGKIPNADLIANVPFSERTFYRKQKNAYTVIEKYLMAVFWQ